MKKTNKEKELKKDTHEVEEEETIVEKKSIKKVLKSKQHSVASDSEPVETVDDLEPLSVEPINALQVEVSKESVESVPASVSTELGDRIDKPGEIEVKIIPHTSIETNIVVSGDKETDNVAIVASKTSQAVINIDTNEPVTIREANVQETTDDFSEKFKPLKFKASTGIISNESVIVSETHVDQDIVETKPSPDESKEARVILTTHEAAITEEVQPSFKESEIPGSSIPASAKAEPTFITQESLSVLEVTHTHGEEASPELIKPVPLTPRVVIPSSESIEVTEIFGEIKPEKYYPELIVPTEVADRSIVAGNKLIQKTEIILPEKEGTFSAPKFPERKQAEVKLSLDKSIVVSNLEVHEKEEQFLPEKQIDSSTASTSFTPFEGVQVTDIQDELKEQEFFIDEVHKKKVNIVVDRKEPIIATINTPIEKEQSLILGSETLTKTADFNVECLETSNVSEILPHETESTFESVDRPKGIYPQTSVQPLNPIEVMETQTGDAPADLFNPLKYSTDTANQIFETVESKGVAQIFPQEKVSPLEVNVTPKLENVTQDVNEFKSVQIIQTLPAEKEEIFKSPQIPESHRGKQVPGQPLHSLIVEEILTENTTGEVLREPVLTQTVKVNQGEQQGTIIEEVICDESIGEKSVEAPSLKLADLRVVPKESIEISEVLLIEKEKDYEKPLLPSPVFAEKSIRTQEAIQTSEVQCDYQSSRFSPETVAKSVAQPGSNLLEPIFVTEYETSEKESTLPIDIYPEKKTATLDFEEDKQEVCITQVEIAEKEENILPKEFPKSVVATSSVSGHKIAVKTEIQTEQHSEDLLVSEEKKRLATIENIPHEEIIITEVNITEQEQDLAKFKLGPKEANVVIVPEEAVNITEVISADNESILKKEKQPTSQMATAVVLQQEIAEQSEIIANINTGVFKRRSPERVQAKISQESLQYVISSEQFTGEKESELADSIKPTLMSANLNIEEEQALNVIEVNTTDKESPIFQKEKPKETFASIDIKGQNVAAVAEPFININTGEVELFSPSVSRAKPENLPFEAVVNTEVLLSESEGMYNPDVRPELKQAKPSVNEEIGLTVSIVTCEDKEQPLLKEKYVEDKCRQSQTESHTVASSSEIVPLSSTSGFDTIKPKSIHAMVNQTPHESIEQNIVLTHEKEDDFEGKLKLKSHQANVSFEVGKSTTVLEIVTGQSEEELEKDILPENKRATVNVSGTHVAEMLEVICDVALADYAPRKTPSNKATVSYPLVEGFITSEIDLMEKEVGYDADKIVKDEQKATLVMDDNAVLQSLVVSQEIPEEKEDSFEGDERQPSAKIASITLQEQKSLPSIEEVTLLDKTTPYQPENLVGRHATPDVQNQTLVAEQYEVMTNISEGTLHVDTPKSRIASVQQDTFEGVLNTEILVQDKENKLNEDVKPSLKTANLNVELLEAASTFEVGIQDKEEDYHVEEVEKQKAKSEFIPNLVAQKIETIPEQDISEISISTTGTYEAKRTIIPHSSITQSTTEVSESEGEFADKFKPAGKTACVGITEDNSLSISEINVADKEDILFTPEKQQSFQAHPNITAQEVVVITETLPSLSVSDIEQNVKHDLNTATIDQTSFTGLTQTQVQVLDKEQDFKQPAGFTAQSASVTFEEEQSINVTTHCLTDTVDEFHVSEKPSTASAKIEIPTQDSIQQMDVIAESQTEPLIIQPPKNHQAIPTRGLLESIGVSEKIIQESESDFVGESKDETLKATVQLVPQEVISVSSVDVQEKESSLASSKIPMLAKATPNISEHQVVQKTEIIPENTTANLSEMNLETKQASSSSVPLEHLIQTQPTVHEPSEQEFKTSESDLKTGSLTIEGERKVATKSEVLSHDKENELQSLDKPQLVMARKDIRDHESLISSEIVSLEKERGLPAFVSPAKVSASQECIPFESVEQAEVVVQESDDVLNIVENKKKYKIEETFQEMASVNVQEVVVQESEAEGKVLKLPIPEVANVEVTRLEELQSTEVISDTSLGLIPSSKTKFETAKRGMPTQQQSVEVTMAPTHESESILENRIAPTATAPFVIEPLESLQVTEVTPEEKLGKCCQFFIPMSCYNMVEQNKHYIPSRFKYFYVPVAYSYFILAVVFMPMLCPMNCLMFNSCLLFMYCAVHLILYKMEKTRMFFP